MSKITPLLQMPNGIEVRSLWRIHMRHLGLTALDRKPFTMQAACRQHCTEKEAVQQIRKRFTAKWWEDVLITDAEYIGDLHMIDGEALQEE